MTARKRIGIVLFQLGGPDSLEAVEPATFEFKAGQYADIGVPNASHGS